MTDSPPPITGAKALLLLLTIVFGSAASLRSQPEADDGAPSGEEGPAAAEASGLSEKELTSRREALEKWTFEPVALEETSYRLLMDRRTSRFTLEDRRTGVSWYSSWGRQGFASILLADGEAATPRAEWVSVDKVRRLVAGEKRIRFSAGPSASGAPTVDFVLEKLPGGAGVHLEYEVPPENRERIQAVRIFHDCFWVSDADGGSVVLPRGPGEKLDADGGEPVRRRLCGTALLRPAAGVDRSGSSGQVPDPEPASLSCAGFLKDDNALFLRWFDTFAIVEAERRTVEGAAFPGTRGVFFSLESSRSSGAVEVYTLGEVQLEGVDVIRAYRELLGEENPATLRYKTGVKVGHRSFVGAALFRPAIGASDSKGSSFRDVADFAKVLKERLDIDRAAFVLQGALQLRPRDGNRPARLSGLDAAGGEDALIECGRVMRKSGFLLGVEIPLSLIDEYATLERRAGAAADDPDRSDTPPPEFVGPIDLPEATVWSRRSALLEETEAIADLQDALELDLLFLREMPVELRDDEVATVVNARASFYERVLRSFDLVGVSPGTELDVGKAIYLGGVFEAAEPRWSTPPFFPLFPAAFGHSVRFGRPVTAPLQANDPKGVLFHLLLGEVPLYATPDSSDDWRRAARAADESDPRWVFARDDGWAEGKGLSAYEVFLRNTYEVLSHVARHRSRSMMLYHKRLTPDGSVRETYFGQDMRIVVNVGDSDYEDEEDGFVLPPYGFYVRYPFILAFHALRVNDHSYERPAFYVIRSLEGKMIYRAERVSIYRGFGPAELYLAGKRYDVQRELVTKLR